MKWVKGRIFNMGILGDFVSYSGLLGKRVLFLILFILVFFLVFFLLVCYIRLLFIFYVLRWKEGWIWLMTVLLFIFTYLSMSLLL